MVWIKWYKRIQNNAYYIGSTSSGPINQMSHCHRLCNEFGNIIVCNFAASMIEVGTYKIIGSIVSNYGIWMH